MGIHGLSSYAKSIGSLWTKTELRQTSVVIDGSSLMWHLYLSNGIDCRCGGDYDQQADVIEGFFSSLTANGVKAFVIIDGPTVARDKKLERIYSRMKDYILSSYKLSTGAAAGDASILPLMAKGVFIQELGNLGISFAVCDWEADQEVASLANQLNCPVVSNDSDYLIFDLPAGYIPLSSLNWNSKSITGMLYKRQRLADRLKIPPEFLPLFASLVGNDFIEENTLAPFERALLQTRAKCNRIRLKMMSVADLLSKSTNLDSALESALDLVPGEKRRAKLKTALEESMKEYEISDSTLKGNLELGEVRTSLKTLEKEEIPMYIIERYRKGVFPIRYMGVLTSRRRLLHVQVENSKESSAHNCSYELRRVNYGIIIKPIKLSQKSKEKRVVVEEWSRVGGGLKKLQIQPFCGPLNNYGELPSLDTLEELEVEERRKLLLVVLEANIPAIKELPEEFQLFAASVRYWISKATPCVDKTCVQVLLLVHLMLIAENKDKTCSKASHHPKKCLRSCFDINCQHSFAQWQAVVVETFYLNRILLDPFVEPKISTLYSGVTAQSVVQEVRQGKDAENFVKTLDIYKQLFTAVTEGLPMNEQHKDDITKSGEQSAESCQQISKKRDKKQKKPNPVLKENTFALLSISDESEDES